MNAKEAETLHIGVIGTGDIARKAYLPGLNDPANGFELTAVCDLVPQRADEMAQEFGAKSVFYTHEAMLEKGGLDLVFVLTPMETHADLCAAALMAGSHVYAEKPMTMNQEQAEDLCELAEFQGRFLLSAPPLLLYPEYQLLQETVQAGAVGQVLFARANYSNGGANRVWWRTDSSRFFLPQTAGPIPPLYDMGISALTVLTSCLGSVQKVTAFAGIGITKRLIDKVSEADFVPRTLNAVAADTVAILLDFGNGCFGTLDTSFCLPYQRGPRYEFYGYEGGIQFGDRGGGDGAPFGLELISENPDFASPDPKMPVQWHEQPQPANRIGRLRPNWGQVIAQHVRDCISGAKPRIPGTQARHIIEILEAIEISSRSGRAEKINSEFVHENPDVHEYSTLE